MKQEPQRRLNHRFWNPRPSGRGGCQSAPQAASDQSAAGPAHQERLQSKGVGMVFSVDNRPASYPATDRSAGICVDGHKEQSGSAGK
jgi:hypothetical protein